MFAIVGAGAMGTALAIHHARGGNATTLVGTEFDDGVVTALQAGDPHPALGVTLPTSVECHRYQAGMGALSEAAGVIVAVSSGGLGAMVRELAPRLAPEAIIAIATKGWDDTTLQAPSEIVAEILGSTARLAVLAGPALAPELVAGAPTAMVCAAEDAAVADRVRALLQSGAVAATVTDDVVGVETAAAYKNVVAIAVGVCEGLGEVLTERVYVHRYANARAAIFAAGLRDMSALAQARGGRVETILGPAGAGDLYVTCLGGRNGTLGRLLGSGETPEQAEKIVGSTVEGVTNTRAALAVAERLGVDLPTARAVDALLSRRSTPEVVISELLRGGPA